MHDEIDRARVAWSPFCQLRRQRVHRVVVAG
jgi:hypothetical protein